MKKADLNRAVLLLCIASVFIISFNTTVFSSDAGPQDVEIVNTWSGDYPVARLDLLPEDQRQKAVGFIDNAETFAAVWKIFKQDEGLPEIDFARHLVLFARNTRFYNLIFIGRVVVNNAVAEVLAMETLSAMPIEDKVGMSLAVVPRKGIKGIMAGDDIILMHDD